MLLLVTAMDKNKVSHSRHPDLVPGWQAGPEGPLAHPVPAQDPVYPGHVPEWAEGRLSSLYMWISLSECLTRCLQGALILGTW